jgi:predicted dithiol-disulfide oxidoreductase (DUF899 family)
MSASLHDNRFPNESEAYRTARNALLESEMALRRQLEAVAAERRRLPLGGEVKEDYLFDEVGVGTAAPNANGRVRLSELFTDGKDSLLVYSFMFGPRMKAACPSCTSILDGLDGEAPHVMQRANFAVVAKSPAARIAAFAEGRGWRNLRLLSSSGNTYNADYHGEGSDGSQWPTLNVFTRRNGQVYHSWASELLFAKSEPGQDGRHVDLVWPLWNMLDLVPEGRGTDWNPRLTY